MAEPPIFSLHGPEWTPSHSMGSITHLVVSHGNIFVGVSSGKIMRLGIGTGEYEELDLPAAYRSNQVHAIFADVHSPSALLVALRPAETLYFHRGKGRQLGKAKGISVTSVAWMRCDASRPDVREVLLGSATGVIYEAAIEPQRTKYLRQLHALHPAQSVTGLQVEPFPTDARRWLVLAATTSLLFEFTGGPSLEALFAEYRDKPPRPFAKTSEVDTAAQPATTLQLNYRSGSTTASAFCWMTPSCLYFGRCVCATLLWCDICC